MFLCDQATKLVDVIGVSETWSSIQKEPLTNTNIEGYNFYQTKLLSQNGGVGLNIKKSPISSSCESLNFECNEFETVWVEVQDTNGKNYLFCCAVFTSHLQSILPKLTNKQFLLALTLIFSIMISMLQQMILLIVYFATIFSDALTTLQGSLSILQPSLIIYLST